MNQMSEKTVAKIVLENPATVRVFETFGIDYCCGGARKLTDACERAGVALEPVLELLEKAGQQVSPETTRQWSNSKLSAIADHIVEVHHSYVRRETPRLAGLLTKVVNRHGEKRPEVGQIEDLFTALSQELSTHMMKEEQILFPYIGRMEQSTLGGQAPPASCFGSVAKPIANMLADHDDAGAVLARMRELSNGYTPPEGACPTFRALYSGLQEFERDLHQHVHLENNILFPRAVAMENVAAGTVN